MFHGIVNYGTQSGLFARELRNNGIDSISVVVGDPNKRIADISLLYGGNCFSKLFKHGWNHLRKYFWFFKYNTFHFYFGRTLFKNQMDLPFYKFFGKKVVMEYLGNDIRHYETLVRRYNLPQSHSFRQNMNEHDAFVAKRIEKEKKHIDFKLCCLPSHMDYALKYNYKIDEVLPLAIDITHLKYNELKAIKEDQVLRILHAPTNREFKGTKYIENAIDELLIEGQPIELIIVENITHNNLIEEYIKCDLFIDQISIGWYGTAALEAMAIGRPTCAFIDDRYFKYISYSNEIPIINIDNNNITKQLRGLIENKDKLPEIGLKSRVFVEQYHDIKSLTNKLINIYINKVWNN